MRSDANRSVRLGSTTPGPASGSSGSGIILIAQQPELTRTSRGGGVACASATSSISTAMRTSLGSSCPTSAAAVAASGVSKRCAQHSTASARTEDTCLCMSSNSCVTTAPSCLPPTPAPSNSASIRSDEIGTRSVMGPLSSWSRVGTVASVNTSSQFASPRAQSSVRFDLLFNPAATILPPTLGVLPPGLRLALGRLPRPAPARWGMRGEGLCDGGWANKSSASRTLTGTSADRLPLPMACTPPPLPPPPPPSPPAILSFTSCGWDGKISICNSSWRTSSRTLSHEMPASSPATASRMPSASLPGARSVSLARHSSRRAPQLPSSDSCLSAVSNIHSRLVRAGKLVACCTELTHDCRLGVHFFLTAHQGIRSSSSSSRPFARSMPQVQRRHCSELSRCAADTF
mmetsp:Transcript_10300/g.24705  ORF Transcript_10300/g.24705 Transcript_10300/m.24705 type:complete len:403 (+) Transcript_10300:92-1300(+)